MSVCQVGHVLTSACSRQTESSGALTSILWWARTGHRRLCRLGCSSLLLIPDAVISAIVPTMTASRRSAPMGYRLGASRPLLCDLRVCAEGPAAPRALSAMWHKAGPRRAPAPARPATGPRTATNSQPDPLPQRQDRTFRTVQQARLRRSVGQSVLADGSRLKGDGGTPIPWLAWNFDHPDPPCDLQVTSGRPARRCLPSSPSWPECADAPSSQRR
jgi:hypothetical protein